VVVVLVGVEGRSSSPSLRVCLVFRKRVKKGICEKKSEKREKDEKYSRFYILFCTREEQAKYRRKKFV